MVGSIYGGYKTTLFLFSRYIQPFSVPTNELNDYQDLWLYISILSDLLTEYHERMTDKGDSFAVTERTWINQTARPTLIKIREKISNNPEQREQNSDKVEPFFRQFKYLCERIDTMFQFPGDVALKKAVFADFYQFLQFMDGHLQQRNIKHLIPLSRIITRFQKLL